MTIAVCLRCGAMKHGAWTPCLKCRHMPEDLEDKAKHLMTTDHYFSKAELEGFAARVQNGLPVHFEPAQVEHFVAMLKAAPDDKAELRSFAFRVGAVVLVVVVGVLYLVMR